MKYNQRLIKVMVVEDDPVVLQRLSKSITDSQYFLLIAACNNYTTAENILAVDNPDVLLTDLDLPDGNGIELIHKVRTDSLDTLVMVISVFGDERHVLEAISAGAVGYLHKDDESFKIEDAILKLLEGESPISPSIARQLLKRFQPQEDANLMLEQLTKREKEILKKVAKGYTAKEIALMEELSYHTIATHIKNVYRKLAVNSKGEAIFEASRMKLI